MADRVVLNTKSFDAATKKILGLLPKLGLKALDQIALEILRLSTFEVPHDLGMLQASGTKEARGDTMLVGYNKVYAARLHENPQFQFQKGRKGKYLEDPIKNNLAVLKGRFAKVMKEMI